MRNQRDLVSALVLIVPDEAPSAGMNHSSPGMRHFQPTHLGRRPRLGAHDGHIHRVAQFSRVEQSREDQQARKPVMIGLLRTTRVRLVFARTHQVVLSWRVAALWHFDDVQQNYWSNQSFRANIRFRQTQCNVATVRVRWWLFNDITLSGL